MKNIGNIIMGIFFAAVTVWLIGFTAPRLYEIYKDIRNTEIRTDTVVTEKHDTILLTDTKPYAVIKYKTVTDTLKTTDSVKVPVEVPLSLQKYEGDTLSTNGTKVHYRANVTGYRASLDSLMIDVMHKDSIITIEKITQQKTRKWAIGLQVGYGYCFKSKQAEPFIGIGVSYRIF